MSLNGTLSRRRFLRQSFAFSALAALGALPSFADSNHGGSSASGSRLLMVGDWGYEDFEAQTRVANAMRNYVKEQGFKPEALLMLGDHWYGPLPGGVKDQRWQTQFKEMYPKRVFDCPAYAIPGTMITRGCRRVRWPRNWSMRRPGGRDGRCLRCGIDSSFRPRSR